MNEAKVNKTQMSVWLPEGLRREAKMMAAAQGRSLTELVCDALEDYIDAIDGAAALAEAKADPSTVIPWEDVKAELREDGVLDE